MTEIITLGIPGNVADLICSQTIGGTYEKMVENKGLKVLEMMTFGMVITAIVETEICRILRGPLVFNQEQKKVRRGGAPVGNQNATKPKGETTQRVTIRLYELEQGLVKAIARELEISQNEAHRQAIKMLAESLGLSG